MPDTAHSAVLKLAIPMDVPDGASDRAKAELSGDVLERVLEALPDDLRKNAVGSARCQRTEIEIKVHG